jgi:hypothetical protein
MTVRAGARAAAGGRVREWRRARPRPPLCGTPVGREWRKTAALVPKTAASGKDLRPARRKTSELVGMHQQSSLLEGQALLQSFLQMYLSESRFQAKSISMHNSIVFLFPQILNVW